MALKRISYKHTDIITNGEMQPSLQMIKKDQQDFLKKPTDTWNSIAPSSTASVQKS
jgi:hypothetical protein